jgi:hypothetical protein
MTLVTTQYQNFNHLIETLALNHLTVLHPVLRLKENGVFKRCVKVNGKIIPLSSNRLLIINEFLTMLQLMYNLDIESASELLNKQYGI